MAQDYLVKEDELGKVYDSRIMRRLYAYARPYTAWLLLALLFAAMMSAAQIMLPYLSKIAIDSYIIVSGKVIDLSIYSDEIQADISDRYQNRSDMLIRSGIVIREGIIETDDRRRFETDGSILPGNFYLLNLERYDIETAEMLREKVDTGVILANATTKPDHFYVESNDLKGLSSELRRVIRRPDLIRVRTIALLYLGVLLISFVIMFSQVYVMAWVGQKIMFDIRVHLFDHIQRLHIRFFSNQPVGRLVTRVSNDVNVLNEVFTSILVEMLKNVLMLAGIVIVMLKLAPGLALITFCILPPMIAITWLFKRKMRDAYRLVRKKIALINATISEHLSGIKVIQAFARENLHFKKFEKINSEAFNANMKELITQSLFSPFVVFLENLGIALILYYGGGQVVRDAITLGTLVAFLSYLSMFFGPVRDIAEKFNIMQSAMASSERIFQILDIEKEQEEDSASGLITQGSIRGEIEFRNVWFAYNNEDWVLRDVSFHVDAGETVAFVGATGSGKTTIINLLTRFYAIQKGEILVDGCSLSGYDRGFIRQNMAMVLQDVFLFAGDISSNIRLNNALITDETVRDVAHKVNAHRFIERLNGGFDHVVREGGSTLSQGQRQLLAFARALALDPSLLILDEATANIDSETEQWIQKGLDQLLQNRTALVVAHRLSTIKKADKIVVLHKGQICEIGNHQTLLAKRGVYHKLYLLQFRKQE